MTTTLLFACVLIGGELMAHGLFFLISKFIGKTNKDKITDTSVLKGLLERFFILVTLHFGMTQSLTLLGALKIATRIKDEDRVSNDFFLIGNLVSVLFGIGYYRIFIAITG